MSQLSRIKEIWEESRMVYKESKSSIKKKKEKNVYVNMKSMDLETYCITKSQ